MSQSEPLEIALASLGALQAEGESAFAGAKDTDSVEAARIEFLGLKQGRLKAAQERLKSLESGGSTRRSRRSRRHSRRRSSRSSGPR